MKNVADSEKPRGRGLLGRLRQGLARTRRAIMEKFSPTAAADRDTFIDNLEEALIGADMGVETTLELLDELRDMPFDPRDPVEPLLQSLKERLLAMMEVADKSPGLNIDPQRLNVITVVGVNGTGKTTSVARLARRLTGEGMKVVLAAGDTFRAAASEQLEVWGERLGVDVIRQQTGADPASVAFDAIQAARARGAEVVIVDTAGRLHTQVNLMEELRKIHRVVDRAEPGAPHEVLLTLDATTGQNAVHQAKMFAEAVQVTGIVLTKLDSSARGGVVVAVAHQLGLPVKLVGLGEGPDDMETFDPALFVEALLGDMDEGAE